MLGALKPRRCSAYRSSRMNWSKKCASHNQSVARAINWGQQCINDVHTNSLETIQWRRSRRRIETVPLTPTSKASGIPSGDLFDPFLDARLCCGELSFSDHVFNIASSAAISISTCISIREELPTPCVFARRYRQVSRLTRFVQWCTMENARR
jgi:hypothetical protein